MKEVKFILDHLKYLERLCKDDYSLYDGKTGLSLAYYLLFAKLKDNRYLAKGQSLIEDLSENISQVQTFDMESGLSGIGWGIEWLIQNKFIDANSDEILADIDDELYKTVVYSKSANLSIATGTIGKALYFYTRLCAKNPNTSRYRNICNQECLVLLIDELSDKILNDNKDSIRNEITSDNLAIRDISQVLLFLSSSHHLKINIETVNKIICVLYPYLESHLLSDKLNNNILNLYLIYACYKTGQFLKDENFKQLAINSYRDSKFSITDSRANNSFDTFLHFKLANLNLISDTFSIPLFSKKSENCIFPILASISMLLKNDIYKWELGWGM